MQQLRRIITFILSLAFAFKLDTVCAQTTCISSELNWYTNAIGESPCTTYQRLRYMCDQQYQLGYMTNAVPGDTCDTQLNACCCNSISFALSMLCLNCQQYGASGSPINGGAGAYAKYLSGAASCSSTNHTLPSEVQLAVCNTGLKLGDFLYSVFSSDGSWLYTTTEQAAQQDIQSNNNNIFTNCPNLNSGSSSNSSSSSGSSALTTATATTSPKTTASTAVKTNTGAIAGGVVGGVVVISAVLGASYFLGRRYNRRKGIDTTRAENSVISPRFMSSSVHTSVQVTRG